MTQSDFNVDLACGHLPFSDNVFEAIVSQHVIEHLELTSELIPLLSEVHRVCQTGASLWLSCPDLEKICQAYLDDRGKALLNDRMDRFKGYTLGEVPSQHIVNEIFYQFGEHRNLLDLELLTYVLLETGFSDIKRRSEKDLLAAFPDFPERGDDLHTIYVSARA